MCLSFSSVQSLSRVHVWLFVAPWTAVRQASLSITNSQSSLKLMSSESVIPFNHLILCHPLLLPSVFPRIRVFSNESGLWIRWPKYWSFSFNPSNEYSGLISFKTDWFDLLGRKAMTKLDSILKSRFYFADKCLSSQSYGFSSSHVWMWELDYKESWARKNWCFWTAVLEKTLESPLDCKEIKNRLWW